MRTAFTLISLALLSIPSSGCITGCDRGYSDGERSGYVVKLSQKGVFIKTYEGELHTAGGAMGGSAGGDNSFLFTVRDEGLVGPISEAEEKGSRITLIYKQWLVHPAFSMDTDYEIIGIK